MVDANDDSQARFDWVVAKRRLAEAGRSLAEAENLSPEQSRRLLLERAAQLSTPPENKPDTSELLEVVGFRLGEEEFAIATQYVLEMTLPKQITPIPQTESYILGVTNLRGEVTAIIDLARFLGISGERDDGPAQVLVLGAERPEFGVMVDGIQHVMPLHRSELAEPAGVVGSQRELMLGCTDKGILVFDGEALLRCEALCVDQNE